MEKQMVMTILEAHVAPDKWTTLQEKYAEATNHLESDPGLTQTFLLHSSKDSTLWRIATVWQSAEALAAMRQSGATPTGVLIFRSAGAEATLSIFDVVSHVTSSSTS